MDSKQASVSKKSKMVQYIKAFTSKINSKVMVSKSEITEHSKANSKKDVHVDMGLVP